MYFMQCEKAVKPQSSSNSSTRPVFLCEPFKNCTFQNLKKGQEEISSFLKGIDSQAYFDSFPRSQ